jgi:2,3,4,5-tetrahydropyridine-2,6-dicarboxylate N-succinyltransferase
MTISVMKDCIEHSYDRYLLKESFDKKRARQNFNRLMDLLESGELRVADRDDGSWSVNAWIKKGIILGFYLGNISINEAMTWPQFRDKDTFPLRKIDKYNKFRVIPPAAAIRRGAYVGNGAVIITPAFVNIGAYVDADSVVEGTVEGAGPSCWSTHVCPTVRNSCCGSRNRNGGRPTCVLSPRSSGDRGAGDTH